MSKWDMVRLGDVCTTTQGVQIPLANQIVSEREGYTRYLYIGDFKKNNKKLYVKNIYTNKTLTTEDLVMANTGSPGSVFKGIDGILSNNLFKITFDKKKLNFNFLYLYLSSSIFQKVLQQQMKGGIQKHLGHKTIGEQLIPLPPLAIQQQIARTLDTAAALLALRKQQLAELDGLIQSVFIEMFGDPVVNEKGWETGTIRDVVEDVKYGTSKPANEGGQYIYLRMNNITYEGHLDLTNLKYIDMPENEVEKYVVRKGDVLFNRTNSKELVGKTCVFDQEQEMIIAGYIIRIRVNERVAPVFLSTVLNSKYGKTTLFGMCKAIVGQANINAQELQNIKLYIPPITLQTQFATIVEKIEQQKVLVQQAIEETQTLFDSLMAEYFE